MEQMSGKTVMEHGIWVFSNPSGIKWTGLELLLEGGSESKGLLLAVPRQAHPVRKGLGVNGGLFMPPISKMRGSLCSLYIIGISEHVSVKTHYDLSLFNFLRISLCDKGIIKELGPK